MDNDNECQAQIQKILSEVVQICNSDNVFFLGIQIPLKVSQHQPASKMPFKTSAHQRNAI